MIIEIHFKDHVGYQPILVEGVIYHTDSGDFLTVYYDVGNSVVIDRSSILYYEVRQ